MFVWECGRGVRGKKTKTEQVYCVVKALCISFTRKVCNLLNWLNLQVFQEFMCPPLWKNYFKIQYYQVCIFHLVTDYQSHMYYLESYLGFYMGLD